MNPTEVDQVEPDDKDLPLREDIRLLGTILGDTVRAQEGEAVFDLVERLRQTSTRFHRDGGETARRELAATLNALSPDATPRIVRAFSFFAPPASTAEELHHVRRTRAHALAGSPPREGSLSHARARARAAGVPPA